MIRAALAVDNSEGNKEYLRKTKSGQDEEKKERKSK
jgi:hypothetical protein